MQRSIALLAVLAAVACSDTSGPDTAASGSVSFSYTGAQSGTFNVTGAVSSISAPSNTQPWAIGIRDQATSSIGVVGNRPQSQGLYDVVVISANRLAAGTASIDANCDPNVNPSCDGVAVIFNATGGQTASTMLVCVLASGTVTLASVSSTRATGSFSGAGTCVDKNSVTTGFTVSDGTFDVALTSSTSFYSAYSARIR